MVTLLCATSATPRVAPPPEPSLDMARPPMMPHCASGVVASSLNVLFLMATSAPEIFAVPPCSSHAYAPMAPPIVPLFTIALPPAFVPVNWIVPSVRLTFLHAPTTGVGRW